jgi:pimeloyl-ACP methyl ester carboxylesterase
MAEGDEQTAPVSSGSPHFSGSARVPGGSRPSAATPDHAVGTAKIPAPGALSAGTAELPLAAALGGGTAELPIAGPPLGAEAAGAPAGGGLPHLLRMPVAEGVSLNVRHWPGARQPFLLVHGLSSNARLWDAVAADLHVAGHPVYAVDLRSHGESDAPPTGYDTATAAADLAMLGLPGAVVAGQSWGGNVAVLYAARHPESVAGLALVDGGWLDPSSDFGSWAECEATLMPPDIDGSLAADLRDRIRIDHPGWSEGAIDATLANLVVHPDGTLTRRLPVDKHMRIVRSMWDDPPRPYFGALTMPTMLIPALPADADLAASRMARVETASRSIPDPTIRAYPDSDHDLHAQHPHELAADLLTLAGWTPR